MSTNKLKPEQIKAFKKRAEEVLKADEDGFIDIRNIEWFAAEIFAGASIIFKGRSSVKTKFKARSTGAIYVSLFSVEYKSFLSLLII